MKSLYGKLFVGFLVSIIVSFAIAGYVGSQKQESTLQQMVMDDYYRVQPIVETCLLKNDEESLRQIITLSNCQLFIEKDGKVTYVGENNISQLQDYKNHLEKIEDYNCLYRVNKEFVVVEKNDNGTLYYIFNMFNEHSLFQNALMYILVGIFLIGSFIFLIVADVIVKPIKRLTKATNSVGHGNYDVQVNYYGKDELATLSKSFNSMAKRLVKVEENRQKFISDVSHEFQTPLTSIQGFAKILTAEQLNDDQRRRYGGIILEQAIRLSTLSKNMMQLTLLEGDDLQLDKKRYSLINQLQRVINMQQELAAEKKVDIVTEFPKGDVLIAADEDRMEQVFINLVNNAVKYTLEEDVITIIVKKNLMDIEVSIEDTGIGMSQEALQHIYDRFFRADRSRSIRGNGLGLSIVKRIIDLHNFKISVESQEEVGTVFKITIPLEKGLRINK